MRVSFSFRVHRFYLEVKVYDMEKKIIYSAPLPIARAYKIIYDKEDLIDSYYNVSLFIEVFIKWYGTIALLILRKYNADALYNAGILSKFISPSLGTWVQAIRLLLKNNNVNNSKIYQMFDELKNKQGCNTANCSRLLDKYIDSEMNKKTIIDFFESSVTYRNKTRGHGAPSRNHQDQFSKLLIDAYEEILISLEYICRLKLIYVEKIEIVSDYSVHTIRDLSGLNSFIIPEKLNLPRNESLNSRSLYLSLENYYPIIELSPIIVRPHERDGVYFLNSTHNGVEYLSYDGSVDEYYRPDGYKESLENFFSFIISSSNFKPLNNSNNIDDKDNKNEFPFHELGF